MRARRLALRCALIAGVGLAVLAGALVWRFGTPALALAWLRGERLVLSPAEADLGECQPRSERRTPVKTVLTLLVLCVMSVPVCLAENPRADASKGDVALDASKPTTWEAVVARRKADLDQVARELMGIAQDEKAAPDARRRAVFLLGGIKTPESLRFLIENVAIYVPVDPVLGDEDELKRTPCLYALRSTGWAGGEAILDSLGKTKTGRELMFLAEALRRALGPTFAKAAVEAALADSRSAARTKNLTAIKTYLHGG